MNRSMIRYILGWVTLFSGLFLLPSVLIAIIYREIAGFSFVICSAVYVAVGYLITRKKPTSNRFYAKEGYVTVALTWMLISLLGAVPFTLNGDIPFYLDAVFETASGFTTTGSTILTDIEVLNHCSLFWRSFTHWLGGMGVLVFVMAILPFAGGRSIHIMRAESTGPSVEKLVPRMKDTAILLYKIYMGLTVAEFVLLLLGRMPVFEALTACVSTAGTGGFAVLNDSMASYSPYLQYVITLFMLLFGVTFNVYFLLIIRRFKAALCYEELWGYLGVIAVATIVICCNVRSMFATLEEAFRHTIFQVAAVITTTGYMTYDFDLWPALSKTILVVLMFCGACAGSTGGGMKISRFMIMGKYLRAELKRLLHPRMVTKIRINGSVVNDDLIRSVLVYLVGFILFFVVSLGIVTLNGYDLVTNFSAITTMINNIGPGLNLVGPTCNFAFFSPLSKIVFVFDMLAGRLEIIPILVLFSTLHDRVDDFVTSLRRDQAM